MKSTSYFFKAIGWLMLCFLPLIVSMALDTTYFRAIVNIWFIGIVVGLLVTLVTSLLYYKVFNDFNYNNNASNAKWIWLSLVPGIMVTIVVMFLLLCIGINFSAINIYQGLTLTVSSISDPSVIMYLVFLGSISAWGAFYIPGALIRKTSTNAPHIPDFSSKRK